MQEQFWWIAPCGIDCSRCSIHRRTEEELAYWKEKGVDLSLIRCDGCRSERNENHWSPDCELLECCLYVKGLDYCGECPEFPCKKIEEWVKGLRHHMEAKESMLKMKEIGKESWLKERGFR